MDVIFERLSVVFFELIVTLILVALLAFPIPTTILLSVACVAIGWSR